jgi:arylsulfatase A-like enzyme
LVLIVVDDLGWADIGANNPGTFYETPNIDRLASSGVRFTNAYATCSVCSPSRYSLLTGKYPARARVTDWFTGDRSGRFNPAPFDDRLPSDEVTIAEALQDAGYRTFFAGKWHLGDAERDWPEHHGFAINRGGHGAGSPPGGYFSPYKNPRLSDGPKGEHLPWRLARETCDFIAANKGEHFFACLSFYEVHNPRQAPKDLIEKYRDKAAKLGLDPNGRFATGEQVWPVETLRRIRVEQSQPEYAAMVESMDIAVGMVLDKLRALGIDDQTHVVFTSDNGGLSTAEGHNTSNLPLSGGKGWLFEGGVRVPLIIRSPSASIGKGAVCDAPTTATDLYPTALSLLGLPLHPQQHLDGVSLAPLLNGEPVDRGPIFWHYPHYSNQGGFPGGAIRDGRWKLIQRYEDGSVELYDLELDIAETRNMAKDDSQRVAEMQQRLEEWQVEVGARFLEAKGDLPPWRPGG